MENEALQNKYKNTIFKVPLTLIFVLMVTLGIISGHFLSIHIQKKAYMDMYQSDIKREMQSVIRSHLQTTKYPKWQEILELGEKLISNSRVRGGILYSSQGEELSSFGMRPNLNYFTAKNNATTFLFHEKEKMLDIFFKDTDLGTIEHMIYKIDVREYETAIAKKLDIEFTLFLYKLGFAVFICTILFFGILIYPMRKLAYTMQKLSNDPENANKIHLNWKRNDIVGEISRSIDILAKRVNYIYSEELASAEQIIEKSAQSIIQLSDDGSLISINFAAAEFLDIKPEEDVIEIVSSISIKTKHDEDYVYVPIKEIIQYGNFTAMANVNFCKGERKCFINTITIYDSQNTFKRYLLVLHNLTKETQFLEKLDKSLIEKTELIKISEKKYVENKLILESTKLALSQFTNTLKPNNIEEAIILPDRLISKWYDEAHAAGLVSGRLEHNILPTIKGDVEFLEASLRQGLTFVYARSKHVSPVIQIDAARTSDGEIVFSIFEVEPDKNYAVLRAPEAYEPEQPIVLAGLKQALKCCNGRLILTKNSNLMNVVRFALKSGERVSISERSKPENNTSISS